MPGTPTSCANRSLPPASTATDGRGVGHELRTSRSLRRPIAPGPYSCDAHLLSMRTPSPHFGAPKMPRPRRNPSSATHCLRKTPPQPPRREPPTASSKPGWQPHGPSGPVRSRWGTVDGETDPPIGDHGSRQCPLEARASPPIWTGPRAALSSAAIDREWMICVQLEDPAGHIAPGATGYQFPRRRQGPTRLCAWG